MSRNSERRRGEVVVLVHEREEVEADEVSTLLPDGEGVGRGSGEDAGGLVEHRVIDGDD